MIEYLDLPPATLRNSKELLDWTQEGQVYLQQ
jgi:hypothetical protein